MSEFYGLSEEDVIQDIENGKTLSQIADECGKNRSMLSRWLGADEQRSVRAREARELSAQAHEERAEDEIRAAGDPFALSKAKELAHHYRWRASKIAPKQYGDKLETTHKGDASAPIALNLSGSDISG